MLKVTYIQHSCFLVELDDRLLLFDYFDRDTIKDIGYEGKLPKLPEDKRLYVFASHSHKDHFSLEVLRWAKERPDTRYILSKDIRLGRNYLVRNGIDPQIKSAIQFVTPVRQYEMDDMKIETLRSNDAGVAFLVEACGKTIYHAGDLHWWNTGQQEFSGELYGNAYKRELHRIENRAYRRGFRGAGRTDAGYVLSGHGIFSEPYGCGSGISHASLETVRSDLKIQAPPAAGEAGG